MQTPLTSRLAAVAVAISMVHTGVGVASTSLGCARSRARVTPSMHKQPELAWRRSE